MVDPPNHIMNFVTIFAKQYTYKKQCSNSNPSLVNFSLELQSQMEIEWAVAKREFKSHKFCKWWSPIYPQLREKEPLCEEVSTQ